LPKPLLSLYVELLLQQVQAAPVFITDGAGTSATIADAGYFQPGGIGLSYLGREFVN